MTTDAAIGSLTRLLGDATTGPWFWEDDGNTITILSHDARVPIATTGLSGNEEAVNDASLIVEARNSLEKILLELGRLRDHAEAMGNDEDALLMELARERWNNSRLEEENKRLYSQVQRAKADERERCARLLEERADVSREMGAHRDSASNMASARIIRNQQD